jgi:hypothetical protein
VATLESWLGSPEDGRLLKAAALQLPPSWRVSVVRNGSLVEVVVKAGDARTLGFSVREGVDTHRLVQFLDHLRRDHDSALVE